MVLVWKCLVCGKIMPCSDDECQTIPEKCPDCGAPKEELAQIDED